MLEGGVAFSNLRVSAAGGGCYLKILVMPKNKKPLVELFYLDEIFRDISTRGRVCRLVEEAVVV